MDVNVRDYGAVGDDTTDDTLAFRAALAAISSTGGTCLVPSGTYKISPNGITGSNSIAAIKGGMHLVGEDKLTSILHVHEAETRTIILCDGNEWSIENLTIQMSGDYPWNPDWSPGDPPPEEGGPPKWIPGAGAITVKQGASSSHGWKIDNCRLIPTTTGGHTDSGHFLITTRGTNFTISNNYLQGVYPQATGGSPVHQGIIMVGGNGSPFTYNAVIANNVFDGVGINVSGNNNLIKNNKIINCCYGNIFMGRQGDGNQFIRNEVTSGREGWIDDLKPYDRVNDRGAWGGGAGMEVFAPRTLYFANYIHDTPGFGLSVGGRNSVAAFNRIINCGSFMVPDYSMGLHTHENGLSARTLGGNLKQFNASGSLFLGNVCIDTRPVGDKTQKYGIAVQADWIRCVCSIGNNLHGNELGEGFYRNCQPNVTAIRGRDMYLNVIEERQRDMLKSLLDKAQFAITENQYVMLNRLIAGSDLNRPVEQVASKPATAIFRNRFTANWTPVNTATEYRLDVSESQDFGSYVGEYQDLNTGQVAKYIVSGLSPESTYYYRVRGRNASGSGPNSNVITVTTTG